MNIHKKLLSLGFKRTGYHEKEYRSDGSYLYCMVSKDLIEEKRYDYDRKKTITTIRKAPKWTFFYVLEYSSQTKVWAKIEKHNDLSLYLESPRTKNGVDLIYSMPSYSNKNINIQSEKDIIALLPQEIQRELLINSIFN